MNPVRDVYEGQADPLPPKARAAGATHFLRRVLDPTRYNFRFNIYPIKNNKSNS